MLKKKKFPRGVKKFIRKEKARIRREVAKQEEQERQIKEIYKRFD